MTELSDFYSNNTDEIVSAINEVDALLGNISDLEIFNETDFINRTHNGSHYRI